MADPTDPNDPTFRQVREPSGVTFTGRSLNPFYPNPDAICLADIAYHLSNMCRYNGSPHQHYSVAQHSVLVAELVLERTNDVELAKAALMHDSPEAYLPDVNGSWKKLVYIQDPRATLIDSATLGMDTKQAFSWWEDRLYSVIAKKYGLIDPLPPEVNQADTDIFFYERDQLYPPKAVNTDWWPRPRPEQVPDLGFMEKQDPERARFFFISMASILGLGIE